MPSRMAFFRAFFSMDPAHAGMILTMELEEMVDADGPRACGDDPFRAILALTRHQWTPRMRG